MVPLMLRGTILLIQCKLCHYIKYCLEVIVGLYLLDNTALFASLITRTAMDIETLIDSLPNQEYTPKKQVTVPPFFCFPLLLIFIQIPNFPHTDSVICFFSIDLFFSLSFSLSLFLSYTSYTCFSFKYFTQEEILQKLEFENKQSGERLHNAITEAGTT